MYAGARYKCLCVYGGARYKSPEIAENRDTSGGRSRDSLAARAADTYRQKSLNCQKKRRVWLKSEVQPDLRGPLIVSTTVNAPGQRHYARDTMLGARPVFQYKIHVVQSQYYKLCSPLHVVHFMNIFFQRKACCHLYLYRVPVPVSANLTL